MRRVFLGKPIHWAVIAALVILGWLAGVERIHVTDFNLFLGTMSLLTLVVLLVVIGSSPPGEQVTRDAISPPEERD